MAYTPEEIAKFFPRIWNGNFSIIYGINNNGEVTPLKVGDDGTLATSGGGGGGGVASSVLIKGKDGTTERDVKVDSQGRIVQILTAFVQGTSPAVPVEMRATTQGKLNVFLHGKNYEALPPSDEVALSTTAGGDLSTVLRGYDVENSAYREVATESVAYASAPAPGDPNLKKTRVLVKSLAQGENPDGFPENLQVNDAGSLLVALEAGGTLPVSIQSSTVTVPVEVQGVAEVKATSLSVFNLSKANGPFIHPDVTDVDGWMDLRAFSRFAATAIASGYTYDLAESFLPYGAATVHVVNPVADPVTNWQTLRTTVSTAVAGDVILLRDGNYTMDTAIALDINKALTLIGESKEGVIIQTMPAVTAGLNSIITVTSNDVTIASMTIRWQHLPASTNVQSNITATTAAGSGTHRERIRLENLRLEYVEMCITAKLADSRIAACDFVYTGAADNGHRGIYARSFAGTVEVLDNTFHTGLSPDMRFIHWTPDSSGTFTGKFVVARNRQLSPLSFQFFEITSLAGMPNGLELIVSDNYSRESNAFIIFSGLTAGRIDSLGSVTIARNDIANGTQGGPSALTGKGLLGFDAGSSGSVVIRSTPLPIYETGNTWVYDGLRDLYVSIYGAELVAARSVSGFTVAASQDIPAETYPAATGSNLLIYWTGNLQVQYKVVDAEPVGQQLSTTAVSGIYHALVDPTDPADILGMGRVRILASDSADLGGHFAVFAVAK